MKNLTDEILNKYLDGELTGKELSEVEAVIASNPDELTKLKTHKFVDQTLRSMEFELAPQGITQKIMNKILPGLSLRKKKSYFYYSVLGVFGVVITSALIYSVKLLSSKTSVETLNIVDTEKISNLIIQFFTNFKSFFTGDNLVIIGLCLTIIMLVSAIFIHDSYKSFKKKLDSLTS